MTNLKELREEIKTNLSLEDCISILESVGVELKKCGINQYQFKNDKSFMVGIYNNRVIIKDFGKTSFSGDIVAYLNEFNNMELKEATLKVSKYLNKNSSVEVNKMIKKEKSLKTPTQIKSYIDFLESAKDRYFTFKHPLFKSEALAIAPMYIYKQASKSALEEFKRLTCLDIKNETLLVKIFNYDGEIISYKRRRFKGNKWVTASRTAPNNQCYIRDLNKNEPIYILEGHHDLLSAVLIDVNFIAIPTANYREFNEIKLSYLKDREVHFLVDIEDIYNQIGVGYDCMKTLALQVENIAKEIILINLYKFLKFNEFEPKDKLDLSECLNYFESIESFKSYLLYYSNTLINGEVF